MLGQLFGPRRMSLIRPHSQLTPEDVTLNALALFRAYIAGSTLVTVGVISLEPDSMGAKLFIAAGQTGWYVLAAVAGVCLWALVDVLVNDVMPDDFMLRSAMRNRHLTYLALAAGLLSISYVYAASEGWTALILRPAYDACAAIVIAFFDLVLRHRWRLSDDYFSA